MEAPGALIASGRDADVFEFGRGRVLRRSRKGRSMAGEAETMMFVRSHGFPAPEVFDVSDDGCDLVMERIDGPTMLESGTARPWCIRRMGRELAELHRSLHRLPGPDWLDDAPCGTGDRLLHMDLHPLNVLMGRDGPVVIDWTGAVRGEPAVDVALTWTLIASGQVPAGRARALVIGVGRRLLLNGFLKPFEDDHPASLLRPVIEWKCKDPNMTEVEIQRMRSLLEAFDS